MPRRARLILALLVGSVALAQAGETCSRIIAIGDLHGDARRFLATLERAGLVDESLDWVGGESCLVQLGDILDRGSEGPQIVRVLRSLEKQAPGRIHVLLGNHESMNLLGDWRYVAEEEFARYALEESDAEREEAFARWSAARTAREEDASLDLFDQLFPPGWFARRRDLSLEGELGAWLIERPLVLRLGETLFVHGGLTSEHGELGVQGLNERAQLEIRAWLRFRDYLVDEGVLEPFQDYFQTLASLGEWLVPRRQDPELWASIPEDLRRSAAGLAVLEQSLVLAPDSPPWNRSLAGKESEELGGELATLLYRFGVRRIVVGHSPQKSGRIEMRYEGRVFLIDTSAGESGAKGVSALVIEDRAVRTLGVDSERTLVPGDADVEERLTLSRIAKVDEAAKGITKPYVVTLEHEGTTSRALFKHIDEKKVGPSRERNFNVEMVFTDSYRHERAAYLLDRHLGLNLLPVAVIRDVGGQTGALVEWIEGAMTEKERLDARLFPQEAMVLLEQREQMRVFDALILNTDRTLENQLTRVSDWRLSPIDHSRSFRLSRKLPPGFEERPIRLTRRLHAALGELEEDELRGLLDGLLTRQQIRAVFQRRDRLLQRVQRDLREHGENFVFLDATPAREALPAAEAR